MITPAQLALELNKTDKYIRALLREEFGVLPPDKPRWLLDASQANAVRARVGGRTETRKWVLKPGDEVLRASLHAEYRGQEQGGISTPKSTPDVFIFTDPEKGKKYGYDKFEGLREDGNYSYTGEGQVGDQVIDKRGNAALVRSAEQGRIIRLFRTKGTYATYVGSFTLGTPAYWESNIPDINGDERRGYIFNFEPIDAETELLPPYGGHELTLPAVSDWAPPNFADIVVEGGKLPAGPEPRIVSRVEFELQSDFGNWLTAQGHAPKKLSLPIDNTAIEPDLYVPTRSWIVEAKRSASRAHVRTAIGQVLDYVHIARRFNISATPIVLFPAAPSGDLVELIHSIGITLAHRSEETDGFHVSPPASAT
ncbi:hypothetical protein J2Y66_003458 [Paenarthrobacter nitroguajacolicus]|uniref:hypothetical protein n=1 Tax=Paenarthrobacter nitroguajacolicus TaxID=211146 RepID=UPI00285A8102|nr:hypothetical protein [Paenarthrobacter nitroguajacolicus]MDR6988950.1 hypothetical protein [Paenarthrobacter nitroguajacolicus]